MRWEGLQRGYYALCCACGTNHTCADVCVLAVKRNSALLSQLASLFCKIKVSRLKVDASKLHEEITEVLEVCKNLSSMEVDFVKADFAILKTRDGALDALFGPVCELDKYLKAFSQNRTQEVVSGAASSSAGPHRQVHSAGTAPPCELFEQLKTFEEWVCKKVGE